MNIEEVLKITNNYYTSYYCKNDICVSIDYKYNDIFVEIPDSKGDVIKYIVNTCRNDNTNECIKKCNINSECLSNRCLNNYYIFNEETPIINCDNIYMGQNQNSYVLW